MKLVLRKKLLNLCAIAIKAGHQKYLV